MNFHPEILNANQKNVLQQLGQIMSQRHFYLAGGTALALYLGHRHSVDLDWFTAEKLSDPLRLAQELREEKVPFTTGQIERGTLHGLAMEVQVSFLEYRYPLLQPLTTWLEIGCLMASLDDLVCMKLSALTQRGSKKDFVDIYALGLKHCPLPEMLRLYQQKYAVADMGHVIYSLAYFDDADHERMPKLLWDTNWRTIKKTMQEWVKLIAK